MGKKYPRLQSIWLYCHQWWNIFYTTSGRISWWYGELWGDFQTQCRSSCCCNRYTGCNTTGKTAIWDSGEDCNSRRRFRAGLSASEEASQLWVPSYYRTFKTENKHIPGSIPCSFLDGIRTSQIFPGERIRVCTYTDHYRKWLWRSRRDVPRNNDGHGKCTEDREWCSRLYTGFLRKRDKPYRKRTVKCRDIRTGIWKCLYIWTYIPRRELQHNKTCGRVLDVRAWDGICRSGGRHGPCRRYVKICHQLCDGKRTGRDELLQFICRQRADWSTDQRCNIWICTNHIHRCNWDSKEAQR